MQSINVQDFVKIQNCATKKAVKQIIWYLKGTQDQGMIMHVDKSKAMECYVDANFAGFLSKTNWIIQETVCKELDLLSNLLDTMWPEAQNYNQQLHYPLQRLNT